MPDHLTTDLYKQIYGEVTLLTDQLFESEQERFGCILDRDDPDNLYISQMALDVKLDEYGITEAQMKKKAAELLD